MMYIRKIFKQDLRDGKQIAFPKEPSTKFFDFNYPDNPEDRNISFTFVPRNGADENWNGHRIETRLYAAGSESRIDGQLKAFLRDNLNAQIGDLLIIYRKDKDNTNFTFSHISVNSPSYKHIHELLDGKNHTVAEYAEDETQEEKPIDSKYPLQQIFYGAPGTGKSFAIDNLTNDDNTVRTTFHPDSDYASFVGAYKPTMESNEIHYINSEGIVRYTNPDKNKEGRLHPGTEKKIVYKYVPQAFLKAYVAAWSNLEKPYFLVIEEINRGNCAQIFGDLFQLLDRNSQGSSSYAIHADDDIQQFLSTDSKGFGNLSEEQKQAIADFVLVKDNDKRSEIGPKILSGELLLLPPNLRIWATMNTSDQSLFPIDSAFKRRWNWHYVPIQYDKKDWLLHVGDNYYRWGDFLKAINPKISELTESADKQMGYFFSKPDEKHGVTTENNTISEDVFINKVLFYLWTDVLKDFDAGKEPFLNPDTKRAYEFSDFFDTEHDYLEQFVGKLKINPFDTAEPVDEEATDKGSDYKSIEVMVDGHTETSMTKAMIAILQKAAPSHTFAEIEAAVSECITRGEEPIIKKIDNPAEYTKENRWNTTLIKSSDNVYFVVTTMWQRQFLPMIEKFAQHFNVSFEVMNP